MPEFVEQLDALVRGLQTHVDLGWSPDPRITAAIVFGAGLLLAFWGGKLVRAGIVLAFVGLGVWGGLHAAGALEVAPVVGMLVGAGAGGLAGFFMYRLWVGLLSAIVLSLIGLGVVTYQQVLPHVSAYDATAVVVGSPENGKFALPSREEQRSLIESDPEAYLRGLWTFVTEQEGTLPRNVLAVLAAATFVGVAIGLLIPGVVTILGTAAVGTALVAGSIWWAFSQYHPQFLQFLSERPTISMAAAAGFCLLSLLVQWLGWRPNKSAARMPAKAAT